MYIPILYQWNQKLHNEEGIRMVGLTTSCFFSEESDLPLEIYGWKLEHQDEFELNDEVDKTTFISKLLKDTNPNTFTELLTRFCHRSLYPILCFSFPAVMIGHFVFFGATDDDAIPH